MDYLSVVLIAIIVGLVCVIVFILSELSAFQQGNKCKHEWDEVKETDVYDVSFGCKSFCHTIIRCRCSKCGEYKSFKLKG